MSEAWVAWAVLILLVLLAMNRFFLTDIALVIRGLYSRSERSYSDATWQMKVLAWVYRVGIVAMAGYMYAFADIASSAWDYLLVIGVVVSILLLRYGVARFVGAVFLGSRQVEGAFEFRASIYNAVCALMWPMILLMRVVGSEMVAMIVCGVILGLLVLLLLWKSVQLFYKNLLSIIYILLYIIFLEVFPLLGIIFVIEHIL